MCRNAPTISRHLRRISAPHTMTATPFRRYNYVLAPESSNESDDTDRTESVYSMQDKETEYVRDESDTCTKSDVSEYTLNSLPSGDNALESMSSDSSNFIIRTENITVEVNENMSSEREDCVSSSEDSELGQADYWNCAQCKGSNNHPKYRYCMKCFRLRKELYPPKPKGTKKRSSGASIVSSNRRKKRKHSSSEQGSPDTPDASLCNLGKIDMNKTSFNLPCLNGQSFSSLCNEVETIQEAKRLKVSNDNLLDESPPAANVNTNGMTCCSLIGKFDTFHTSSQTFSNLCESADKVHDANMKSTPGADVTPSDELPSPDVCDTSALCIMCARAPKNGVFVHMKDVHSCSCYPCALKVWKMTKKCPTCNLPAFKVMRLYFS